MKFEYMKVYLTELHREYGKKLVNQVFEKTPELYEKVREAANEVN